MIEAVRAGTIGVEAALAMLAPEASLGFAQLDVHRHERTDAAEVIYGAGKTAPQIAALMTALRRAGQLALATRVDEEKAATVLEILRAEAPEIPGPTWSPAARVLRWGESATPSGRVAVVSAGTSDQHVVEEAVVVLEALGSRVERHDDIGIAGIHRLFSRIDAIRACHAVVVVAGMDGALPGVVAGLVAIPVIAVPTSVGYGASFGGLAALLTMLNTCASGVGVVNIDNGFGAAMLAHRINLGAAGRRP